MLKIFQFFCSFLLSSDNRSNYQLGNKIAELVLVTGETINIADAHQDSRFDPNVCVIL